MIKKKYMVATVKVIVEADNQADAIEKLRAQLDAIPLEMGPGSWIGNYIIDWGFVPVTGLGYPARCYFRPAPKVDQDFLELVQLTREDNRYIDSQSSDIERLEAEEREKDHERLFDDI